MPAPVLLMCCDPSTPLSLLLLLPGHVEVVPGAPEVRVAGGVLAQRVRLQQLPRLVHRAAQRQRLAHALQRATGRRGTFRDNTALAWQTCDGFWPEN